MSQPSPSRQTRIRLEAIRTRLAAIWFTGSSLTFGLLIILAVTNGYHKPAELFGWAMPNLLPTLSLMVTVFGSEAFEPLTRTTVRRSFANLTTGLSVIYLLLVFGTVLADAAAGRQGMEFFQVSNLWLGPVQGLTASALGVLFFSRKDERETKKATE